MGCDKIQIVMKSSKSSSTLIEFFSEQVGCCRCQKVRTTDQLAGEYVLRQAHSNGSHLSGEKGGLDHLGAPLVHVLFPGGKLFRVRQ